MARSPNQAARDPAATLGGGVVAEGLVIVTGTPQRIAGWLTGRVQDRAGLTVTGELDDLPRWL